MATIIATIVSSNLPLEGQDNRSSENFEYLPLPVGTSYLTYEITKGSNPQSIYFNVMEDRTLRRDPIIFDQIATGFKTDDLTTGQDLYIANPTNAVGEFEVTVFAHTN